MESSSGSSAVLAVVDLGDETQDRRDHEGGAESDEGTATPDEDGHVRGHGEHDLTGGAHESAHAEVLLPADDGAHHAAGDHEGAGHEGVHHVGELDVGDGGAEVLGEGGGGERQGAVITRGAHLGENQDEDRENEKLLLAPLLGSSSRRHCIFLSSARRAPCPSLALTRPDQIARMLPCEPPQVPLFPRKRPNHVRDV